MPVTVLPAALAVLLAAEPGPSAPPGPTSPPTSPPTSSATSTATSSPPDAEWVTGTGEPRAPSTPPLPRSVYRSTAPAMDWTLAAGWGTTGLMGVTSTGVEVSFEAGLPLAMKSHALPLVSADLFVGETRPGLAIRSLALGAEVWYDAGRFRAGGGLGSGLIGYRRATSGEWALLLTCGLRAGIEVAVLRFGASDVVLGAHGAANLGPWFSGSLTLGYRGRAGPR